MKEMYLIFNSLTNVYFFVEGKNPYNEKYRSEWGDLSNNGLVKRLKKVVNPDRKSILHLLDIPNEIEGKIKLLFSETKIKIKHKKC